MRKNLAIAFTSLVVLFGASTLLGAQLRSHCDEMDTIARKWRPCLRASIVSAACAIVVACATVPKVDQNLEEIPRLEGPAQIRGALGPLTARQSKAILDRIGAEAGDAGMLKRHIA